MYSSEYDHMALEIVGAIGIAMASNKTKQFNIPIFMPIISDEPCGFLFVEYIEGSDMISIEYYKDKSFKKTVPKKSIDFPKKNISVHALMDYAKKATSELLSELWGRLNYE